MDFRHSDNPVPFSSWPEVPYQPWQAWQGTPPAEAPEGSAEEWPEAIGVLLTGEGSLPPEAFGRHCRHCGEDIMVTLAHGGPAQPGSVQEYIHKGSRAVHCVLSWVNDVRKAFADETATPCQSEGCLSNAEYEAKNP